MADDTWKQQVQGLGQFIRTQRKLAKLSLRELAAATDVSNAYLSQLERGLHVPSFRVLRSLAHAFDLSTERLLERAGMLEHDDAGEASGVEAAIKDDGALTEAQKEALLGVYRGFTAPRD
jgi:transcriptional regulator with XRE-family HTH domain